MLDVQYCTQEMITDRQHRQDIVLYVMAMIQAIKCILTGVGKIGVMVTTMLMHWKQLIRVLVAVMEIIPTIKMLL